MTDWDGIVADSGAMVTAFGEIKSASVINKDANCQIEITFSVVRY